ncbi:unnamed protein product [Pseudo-nitzschia multistriata]|uniref:Uncharacterized protein n=1 Tax=Pseudo-nitzschia multistriata TaxID=183589 RepID=A0A448ZPM0_9STRA|nr:unnamed protein product [Pseudo-nitzschia multistriata]
MLGPSLQSIVCLALAWRNDCFLRVVAWFVSDPWVPTHSDRIETIESNQTGGLFTHDPAKYRCAVLHTKGTDDLFSRSLRHLRIMSWTSAQFRRLLEVIIASTTELLVTLRLGAEDGELLWWLAPESWPVLMLRALDSMYEPVEE